MTSRLKRKLDNLGIDASDSKLTESFCMIGTPLPPLEKAKDTGEFVPLWKQEVRDEQGRRRLHGAFTGGFSAGYFNTVGSKEGWTPSTFMSSRSARANKKGARPEDFMDEEDMAEMRDNQRLVDTTEEMDILGGTAAEMRKRSGPAEEKDSIAIALESLVPPARDSVGARLLKKMGWRPGYGIGPRVTYRQLKLQDQQASSVLQADAAPKEEEDEEADKHLYAPRDTKLIVFRAKENAFGLGYVAGRRLDEAADGKERGKGGPNISSGFGLGALNDADEDDLDVYDGGSARNHSRRLAYDTIEEDDDRIALGPSRRIDDDGRGQKDTITSLTFHDGRPVLLGFKLADKPAFDEKWFELPEVPEHWTPDPHRVWAESAPENKGTLPPREVTSSAGPHSWRKNALSADERGTVLGEPRISAPPRSVFDYLSQKDRERLKNMTAAPLLTSSFQPTPEIKAVIAPTDTRTALSALRGFQPFTADPVKQTRYTTYLQSQAQPSDYAPPEPKPGQAIDDFNKEMEDYAKAALIFKPVSGAMANRFTSASVVDLGPTVQEGLHTPTTDPKDYLAIPEENTEEKEPEETPKANAARHGMYGPLTREIVDWFPNRLLCKRFGVRDPHPDGPAMDSSQSLNQGFDANSIMSDVQFQSTSSISSNPVAEATMKAIESGSGLTTSSTSRSRKDLSNIGLGEDDDQGRDTLTYERPERDIFKAIFASDEEDSDEEEGKEKVKDEDEPEDVEMASLDKAAPIPSSKSAPQNLTADSSPSPSYQPKANSSETIDASFRPTFISKAERESRRGKGKEKEKDTGGNAGKREKKSKKKKGDKVLVSFELDAFGDDERENGKKRPREKDKGESREKKKRKEKRDVGEDVWVEKPPPPGLEVSSGALSGTASKGEEGDASFGPSKGRKRAVDFL